MARRDILHTSKLADFTAWLEADGWTIQDPCGAYEVLRAVKETKKGPLVIYKRLDNRSGSQLTHFSVPEDAVSVVFAYLKDRRLEKKAGMRKNDIVDGLRQIRSALEAGALPDHMESVFVLQCAIAALEP